MLSRFIKDRNADSIDVLFADAKREQIECYEFIRIMPNTSTELKEMMLINVAYVSKFMINLVCQNLLKAKNLCVKLPEFDERSFRKSDVYCIRPTSEDKSRII
jgi:hypothetical protein